MRPSGRTTSIFVPRAMPGGEVTRAVMTMRAARAAKHRLDAAARTGSSGEPRPSEAAEVDRCDLGGLRVAVDAGGRPVGAALELQRLGAGPGHGAGADPLETDEHEGLLAVLLRTRPADSHVADAGRVVLQLVLAGLIRVELVDEQDAREAARRDAGPLADLQHPGAIGEADSRPEPERVARRPRARSGLHRDPGPARDRCRGSRSAIPRSCRSRTPPGARRAPRRCPRRPARRTRSRPRPARPR